jgi:enoyl-CoA hydratase
MFDAKFDFIETELQTDQVLLVRLNRPQQANAFNTRMAEEVRSVWKHLESEPTAVRCVVLTGAGERAFCAGADLKERNRMSGADWEQQHRIFEAMSYGIMNSPVPTIAAVNGAAVGGGLELLLACDFACAVPGARLAFPESRLGFMPGVGGTQLLPRRAGLARAREILITGEGFSSDQAFDWGVVNHLYEPAELMTRVMELATSIATNAPLAVAAIRQATQGGMDLSLADALQLELRYYYALVDTDDRKEGILAFNEKRKPVFKGC